MVFQESVFENGGGDCLALTLIKVSQSFNNPSLPCLCLLVFGCLGHVVHVVLTAVLLQKKNKIKNDDTHTDARKKTTGFSGNEDTKQHRVKSNDYETQSGLSSFSAQLPWDRLS